MAQAPRRRMRQSYPNVGVAFFFLAFALLAGPLPRGVADDAHGFQRQILPLLYHRCFSCHSAKQTDPQGGLRLDSAQGIHDSGVIVPGMPENSELLRRVSLPITDPDVMPPPKGGAQPLSNEERDLLKTWIASGAKLGDWVEFNHRGPLGKANSPAHPPADTQLLIKQLDQRIEQRHAAQGTSLNRPISDEVFLRRVYLDVAGRIPSLAESQEFLQNNSPDKRAALIDRLLHGEAYVSHTFNWKADQLRLVTTGIPGQPGWLYDDWVKQSIRSGMPHDEFVRQLVTASGYLWENGAVGFYLRDMGMPLEHMSNMSRIFLGTRMECAQCHDHPQEPITQKDFYQLAGYTYGVSNLYSSAGYSTDNVKQWPAIQARLNEMNAGDAFRNEVSRTISYLKRLTRDTDHRITFPDDYPYDAELRGKPTGERTFFGDEAPSTTANRRTALANWMVSPRNPRFALNYANRLWKRVMGRGLIEPVDSLSVIEPAEHSALLEFLTQMGVGLKFDERAFLTVLLNSRLYQSQSVREEPEPGSVYRLQGPLLRRLSAEQLWDSLLVFIVKDLDERKRLLRHDHSIMSAQRLQELARLTADQIIERARVEMDYRVKHRAYVQQLAQQHEAVAAAKAQGDARLVKELQSRHAAENARFDAYRNAIQMAGPSFADETDPRWSALPREYLRAAEIPTPIPQGHFLRQFGKSDRREIDAFNTTPNITHSLALMNGELTQRALDHDSYLRASLASQEGAEQSVRAIYQAIFVRGPEPLELRRALPLYASSPTPAEDLIWALLNSPEFLFIQ